MRDANATGDREDARLLARIAAGDRQAFERLYHLYFARLADVLGCPQNTVKTRMFYARRRLAALLADRQETP
jgi:RNA polymerase sigma-70 factor (ECF subfamily)